MILGYAAPRTASPCYAMHRTVRRCASLRVASLRLAWLGIASLRTWLRAAKPSKATRCPAKLRSVLRHALRSIAVPRIVPQSSAPYFAPPGIATRSSARHRFATLRERTV